MIKKLLEIIFLRRLQRNRVRALKDVDIETPRQLLAAYRQQFADPDALVELAGSILGREVSAEIITNPAYQAFKTKLDKTAEPAFKNKHYQLGALDDEIDLVALLLAQYDQPSTLEIGVANGYSSAVLYHILSQVNGRITSIDLPRFASSLTRRADRARRWLAARGRISNTGTLGDLNPGGVVPNEKYAGWLVPPALRLSVPNNTFYGNAFHVIDSLPEVKFDFIVIDAMKGYDARLRLLRQLTANHLQAGGICILDGYWVNNAMHDLCNENGYTLFSAGRIAGYVKR